jgi:alpha-L-fucosidase
MKIVSKNLIVILFLLFLGNFLRANEAQDIKNYGTGALKRVPEDMKKYFYASPQDVQWFKDAKFAVFVHWDPSCLEKAEISWGRKGPRPGIANQPNSGVPEEEYNNLYKKFNPKDFNADKWIKMVKDAGAKYFIFTTKHHDGFCMFDAKNTDYKITNTPFGRDICKELADACHKYGIKLFWYYSQPDWYNKDFLSKDHQKYRKYMYEHLRQLLTDYGKVDGVWFDCLNTKWRHWNTPEMVKMIRTLQPGILINSRWGWGMPGVKYNGDFDNPEQKLGIFKIDRPWESCMTMGQGWSWRGPSKLISPESCIRMLIQCVGSGGNLALDCGPRPDGEIDPPVVDNYMAIGKWLKENGESIYGTQGGPYKPGPFGVSTRKNNKIYLHILANVPGDNATISLPPLPVKVLKAYQLQTGKPVKFSAGKSELAIDISNLKKDGIDSIIVLELPESADSLKPIDTVGKDNLVALKNVSASSCYGKDYSADALMGEKQGQFKAGIHHSKTWVARGQKGNPHWVCLEFDKPELVSAITIKEPSSRTLIREFDIEYDDNGTWKKLYSGNRIGLDFSLIFPKVKTSKIRLNILKNAPTDPGLQEFKVYKAEN